MLIQLWLATTWFLYSGPNSSINEIAANNGHCRPSCMMADSIFNNMKNESDKSLVPVKCSFLSYLFEHCWDSSPGLECRPSVDKNMRETIEFYRDNCGSISCFPILSPSDLAVSIEMQLVSNNKTAFQAKDRSNEQQQPIIHQNTHRNGDTSDQSSSHLSLEKARTLCSGKFESLLRVLMNPACHHARHNDVHQSPHGHEIRSDKLNEFKECVERVAGHSCKHATSEFLNTFARHILEHQAC